MMFASEKETMSVGEVAEARRSIRRYTAEPVPEADLREMLRVAGLAPSAWNVQPWRFVVVRDAALRTKLGEAAYGQPQVAGAPAVIVMYSDMRAALETVEEVVHPGYGADRVGGVADGVRRAFSGKTDAEREAWGARQSYIALGYLLLSAASMGYGTSPMLGFDPAEVKRVLGLPGHVSIPAMVSVGVPAEEGFPHHRHATDTIADFR